MRTCQCVCPRERVLNLLQVWRRNCLVGEYRHLRREGNHGIQGVYNPFRIETRRQATATVDYSVAPTDNVHHFVDLDLRPRPFVE